MAQTKDDLIEQIAIYSRKSKFTGKGESIENQIELSKQYIRTHYPSCKDENILVYEDEGFSGGNIERPKFKRMMIDARAKKFSAIVCYRLDRISRNIGDFAKLIEELNDLNVSFVSIKEQFDTSSPMGRAMMYIASVFSQLERETIAERIRDNMHELSKTGRWLGGTSPTGYISESVENVNVDGKIKKACKLKLVPDEAEIIRKIFSVFLETNSLSKTETYFLQNGYKTKNAKAFTRFALRNILTNPVYMNADADAYNYLVKNESDLFSNESDFNGSHGVMAYNRTIQKSGKANQVRPISEWIVAVGKHTGLISGAEWVHAQECLSQNRSKSFRKPRSNVALLSGLLFCTCGDYMRPKMSQRVDPHGDLIYSYLCAMKEKSRSHLCTMKNANGNMLDRLVCEEIKKLGEDNSEFIKQLKSAKRRREDNREEYDDNLERLRGTFSENEKEIAALVSSLAKASGTSAEGYIVKQIDELHNKGEMIKRRITELESITASHALSDIEFDIIRQMLTSLKDTLDDMSVEEKRSALRTFVKRVVWDGENVHVYLFGSDDSGGIDLPAADIMPEGGDEDPINGGNADLLPDGSNSKKGGIAEPLCENSKCYSNSMAHIGFEVGECVPSKEKWYIFSRISNFMYIMVCHSHNVVNYAPLYIHKFIFLQPHFLLDAEKFNIACSDPSQLTTVADKLRYYRYKNARLQREVADCVGIERTTYSSYEEDVRDYYPLDILTRIAEMFGVDITDLLDGYNTFLYCGQAMRIKALRKQINLTQAEFAAQFGVQTAMVKRWEQNKIRMTKKMWSKIFKE